MLKKEFIVPLLILLVAAFLRLYMLPEYMNFLGDEGRDAIVVKGILTEGNMPFIGPPTSVGNMYLGPLYYYMMAVPMTIFWMNPVAAAGMDAFIGVATVGLIYYLAKEWFGRAGAILASFLYAVSPVTIVMSRSSWNPNPAPFFGLLAFLGYYQARISKNYWWLILTGFSLAAALQMHYLALLLVPIFGVLWFYDLVLIKRQKLKVRRFWSGSLMALVVFCLLMFPLVLFDLKHNYMNWRAFQTILFGGSQSAVGFNIVVFGQRLVEIYLFKLVGRYMAASNLVVSWLLALVVIYPLVVEFYQKVLSSHLVLKALPSHFVLRRNPAYGGELDSRFRGGVLRWSMLSLGLWLAVGLVGLAYYKGEIYDHYLGFLNPAPYLLLAAFIYYLPKRVGWMVVGLGVVGLGWLNLSINPLLYPPNRQLDRTQEVAHYILKKAEDREYNFALIAERNYDAAYQFYLGQYGNKPGQLPFQPSGQLYVVCEDQLCQPINHPKYEIVAFGWSKISDQSELSGVKIYKLVPNPD